MLQHTSQLDEFMSKTVPTTKFAHYILLQEENEELKRIIEAYKKSVHDLVTGYGDLIEKKNKEIFDLKDEIDFLQREIRSLKESDD
jgi:cell division protein FtsB